MTRKVSATTFWGPQEMRAGQCQRKDSLPDAWKSSRDLRGQDRRIESNVVMYFGNAYPTRKIEGLFTIADW